VLVRHTTEQDRPYVYVETDGGGEFGYQYVGVTDSLVHILLTHERGDGTGVFTDLLFLTIEKDKGISCDWGEQIIHANTDRLLLKKLGALNLGDRWSGKLAVRGNDVFRGKDEGWFSQSNGIGGGDLSRDSVDRILKIDIDTN
jgi:hypothetical protein